MGDYVILATSHQYKNQWC